MLILYICISIPALQIGSSVPFFSEKEMATHSSTFAKKSHGWRSLVGYSPWGCEESDTIEWLHFHFSLSCIGEGNGNPLQCSCLENPRDGGAWWDSIYGVAQSQTWLKRLSSSSSNEDYLLESFFLCCHLSEYFSPKGMYTHIKTKEGYRKRLYRLPYLPIQLRRKLESKRLRVLPRMCTQSVVKPILQSSSWFLV